MPSAQVAPSRRTRSLYWRRAAHDPARSVIPWGKIFSAMSARLNGSRSPLPSVSAVARENADPFRVLVATMISLRTKDEVTRKAAESLLAQAQVRRSLPRFPRSGSPA